MITPYMFWRRFDRLKRESLKDICARQGIRYDRLLHNRSDCRLPKAEDLVALGDAVGVSIEYLLTGRHHYSARIRRIADHLTDQGEDALGEVERLLGLDCACVADESDETGTQSTL